MRTNHLIIWALLLGTAAPALAQTMPNRATEVAALVRGKYIGLLNGDDVRRREVLGFVCADLNATIPADGNNWGILFKPGRSRQPADALVWRPTLQHADVLTDTGPMWHTHQNTIVQENPAWQWVACTGEVPDLPPPPTGSGGEVPLPPGTGAGDVYDLDMIRRLMVIEDKENQIILKLNAEILPQLARIETKVDDVGTSIKDVFTFIGKYISPAAITAGLTWWAAHRDKEIP